MLERLIYNLVWEKGQPLLALSSLNTWFDLIWFDVNNKIKIRTILWRVFLNFMKSPGRDFLLNKVWMSLLGHWKIVIWWTAGFRRLKKLIAYTHHSCKSLHIKLKSKITRNHPKSFNFFSSNARYKLHAKRSLSASSNRLLPFEVENTLVQKTRTLILA